MTTASHLPLAAVGVLSEEGNKALGEVIVAWLMLLAIVPAATVSVVVVGCACASSAARGSRADLRAWLAAAAVEVMMLLLVVASPMDETFPVILLVPVAALVAQVGIYGLVRARSRPRVRPLRGVQPRGVGRRRSN